MPHSSKKLFSCNILPFKFYRLLWLFVLPLQLLEYLSQIYSFNSSEGSDSFPVGRDKFLQNFEVELRHETWSTYKPNEDP